MLVLFDLDGTLTDPYEGITQSVSRAVRQLHLPPLTLAQQRAFIGPPLQDSFAALGLGAEQVEQAVMHYRAYFADRGIFENRVYDGIPEALAEFVAGEVTLGVATSKPTTFAERILEHFNLADVFSVVSGATLDGTRRHKTDIIDFALATLAAQPTQTVMVGDRAQDIQGAATSGVRGIGVRWGYAEPGELEAAGAQCIVTSPTDLAPVILG